MFSFCLEYVCLYRLHIWLFLRQALEPRFQANCRSATYRAEYEEIVKKMASHFGRSIGGRHHVHRPDHRHALAASSWSPVLDKPPDPSILRPIATDWYLFGTSAARR